MAPRRFDLDKFNQWKASGSVALRNQLITENLGIVHRVVRTAAQGPDYEDLIQQGVEGLITALERYNPEQGGFYSFAKWHVLHEVQKGIARNKGIFSSKSLPQQTPDIVAAILGWTDVETDGGLRATETSMDLRRLLQDASQDERAALIGVMEGEKVTEASERLGLKRPNSHICNTLVVMAMNKARRRLDK